MIRAYIGQRTWFTLAGAMLLVLCVRPTAAEQPADPFRPPAIATQNVPVVPQELIERLRQYQSMREASFAGWSPDGDGMLVRTRFGNSAQLHRVYVPGGRREQITFFDEPVSGRFVPSSRDGAVLSILSRGGSENDQVYLIDRVGFTTSLLTDGKSRNLLGPVRHNGEQMIVLSTRRNGRDTDLYVADVRQAHSESLLMQTEGEFWTAGDWSIDGKHLLLSHYVSINEGHPALFDVAGKKRTALPLPGDGPAAVGRMAFRPDGKVAYITTDARGEFLELGRLGRTCGGPNMATNARARCGRFSSGSIRRREPTRFVRRFWWRTAVTIRVCRFRRLSKLPKRSAPPAGPYGRCTPTTKATASPKRTIAITSPPCRCYS